MDEEIFAFEFVVTAKKNSFDDKTFTIIGTEDVAMLVKKQYEALGFLVLVDKVLCEYYVLADGEGKSSTIYRVMDVLA